MLIEKARHEGIRSGAVTVLFRRWRRCQVISGRIYRTAAGRIAVDQVHVVRPEEIHDSDAAAAGYAGAVDVIRDLRGRPEDPVYLLRIRYVDEPDPRDELAASGRLSADDIGTIDGALQRLDVASRHGPWTREVLRLLQESPGVRAADLAAGLGHETLSFKADVRKLKNLGLTISLDTGYRLSARGEAYLAQGRSRGAREPAALPDLRRDRDQR